MGRGKRGGKRRRSGKRALGKICREEKYGSSCAPSKNESYKLKPRAERFEQLPRILLAAEKIPAVRNGRMDPVSTQQNATVESAVPVTPKELVSVGSLNLNLCLFFSAYNALQTDAQRKAFSCGNLKEPTKAFIEFVKSQPFYDAKMTAMHGYTVQDMTRYLQFLKTEQKISSYEWRTVRKWSALSVLQGQKPMKYVLLGSAATSEQLKSLNGKLNTALKLAQKLNGLATKNCTKRSITRLNWDIEHKWIWSKFNKPLRNKHAISVVRTSDGKSYYYDNKNFKPRLITRPLDVAQGLVFYHRVVKFDLIL